MRWLFVFLGALFFSCNNASKTKSFNQKPNTYTRIASYQTDFFELSRNGGIYKEAFQLSIKSNADIYYTLNGSIPHPDSTATYLYDKPIEITNKTNSANSISNIATTPNDYADYYVWSKPRENITKCTTIIFLPFKGDSALALPEAFSYFIIPKTSIEHRFPIISLVTDSSGLFSYQQGIYVPGINSNQDNLVWTGNSFQDWVRTCHFEFFDASRERVLHQNIDIKIHGLKTPAAPQKSLRLYAKKKYGQENFNYSFFEGDSSNIFKRLILRTLHSSWNDRINADLIACRVADEIGLETMKGTPVVVYLNGEYWGIHNLRERIDRHHFANRFNVNPDSVNISEGIFKEKEGTISGLINLLEFTEASDLSNSKNFNRVSEKIDLNNLIDYYIIETYFGNADWPTNNHKMWSIGENSKWRYIVIDMDATIKNTKNNYFEKALQKNYKSEKTIWQKVLFTKLIENKEFKAKFKKRYIELLDQNLSAENIVMLINDIENNYKYEIQAHILRWNHPISYNNWLEKNDLMRDFARNRKRYISKQLEKL